MTDIENDEPQEFVEREQTHKQDAYITVFDSAPIHQFLYGRSPASVTAKTDQSKTKR
jgi:hypothetical protein